jgi:hypothetical protein
MEKNHTLGYGLDAVAINEQYELVNEPMNPEL